MWTLIILIAFGHGAAATNIPGFTNQWSCEAAAEQSKRDWNNDGPMGHWTPVYTCVRVREGQ
jgi:coenzyme F420-reducing hydrogenase gamma subunit